MTRTYLKLLSLTLLCLSPLPALGGTILSVSFSGPGGTGVDGGTSGNTTEPRLSYTSVDYIDVFITVDSAGSYLINEAPGLGSVRNLTGTTWTGFETVDLSDGLGSFDTDWFDFSGKLPTTTFPAGAVLFSGGTAADTEFIDPFGHYITNGPGTIVLRQFPLVPEPSSIALLAAGVVGVGAMLRRRR